MLESAVAGRSDSLCVTASVEAASWESSVRRVVGSVSRHGGTYVITGVARVIILSRLCAAVAVTARRVMWSVSERGGAVIRVLLRYQLWCRLNSLMRSVRGIGSTSCGPEDISGPRNGGVITLNKN